MIESSKEFCRLRYSDDMEDQNRATYEEISELVLLEIIEKHPAEIRKWVAHNKKVPLHILRKLADDPDWSVRCTVARRNKIDEDLCVYLSKDSDETVRRGIAANKRTPVYLLEELSRDSIEDIAEMAQRRLKELKKES